MKKFLVGLLAGLSVFMGALGLAACESLGDLGGFLQSTLGGGENDDCEHVWSVWSVQQEATCETKGQRKRVCTVCNKEEKDEIALGTHVYNTENVCTVCGDELEFTTGLEYAKKDYYSHYEVVGIGNATDTDIVIPASHAGEPVVGIAAEAFKGNDQITSVYIPDGIETIGAEAFYYCISLKSVRFSSDLEEIGARAFNNCTQLTPYALPDTKIELSTDVFTNTAFYNDDKNWSNGTLYLGNHLIKVKEDYSQTKLTIKEGTRNIASRAVENATTIKEIVFPENEIFIGGYAFSGCVNWKEFEITDTMAMGAYALSGSSLTKLIAPAKDVVESITETTNSYYRVDIGIPTTLKTLIVTGSYSVNEKLSFSNFKQLEHLEHNFRHIGYYGLDLSEAYKDLKNLKTLTMPGGVIHIGEFFSSTYYDGGVPVTTYVNSKKYTYYFPASLKEITIDGGSVGERMFYGCDNFESIIIKNLSDYGDEDNIGNDALTNVTCENLSIDNSISKISDIYLYKDYEVISGVKNLYYLGTIQDWCSVKREDFLYVDNVYIDGQKMEGNLIIPEEVNEIPDKCFYGFKEISNIIIPDSVKQIGVDAFSKTAFYDNEENWKNGVLYCGKHLIKSKEDDCGNTIIKDGTLVIADEAFKESKNLPNEILFPDSVVTIGNKAFSNTGLVKLTIGENVEYIGKGAFYCQQLNELKYNAINAKTDGISGTHFAADGEVKLTIGHNVKNLPTGVFSHLSVKEVVFERVSVCESIGDYAFYNCARLMSIEIPNSVINIGNCAFEGCSSLTSITIPSTIQTMGSPSYSVFGFSYHGGPLTVYCEASEQPNDWSSSWNGGCPVVWDCKNNEVATDGYMYAIIDEIRYGLKDSVASVVEQSHNIITANIPTTVSYKNKSYTVTSIKRGAFYECGKLLSVKIPNTITSIENDTFNWCISLKSVEIPDSVTNIGNSAFRACYSLTSIEIPNSVKSIGENAFANCKLLSSITIGNSVSSIGNGAFYDCDSLVSIEIPDGVGIPNLHPLKNNGVF